MFQDLAEDQSVELTMEAAQVNLLHVPHEDLGQTLRGDLSRPRADLDAHVNSRLAGREGVSSRRPVAASEFQNRGIRLGQEGVLRCPACSPGSTPTACVIACRARFTRAAHDKNKGRHCMPPIGTWEPHPSSLTADVPALLCGFRSSSAPAWLRRTGSVMPGAVVMTADGSVATKLNRHPGQAGRWHQSRLPQPFRMPPLRSTSVRACATRPRQGRSRSEGKGRGIYPRAGDAAAGPAHLLHP